MEPQQNANPTPPSPAPNPIPTPPAPTPSSMPPVPPAPATPPPLGTAPMMPSPTPQQPTPHRALYVIIAVLIMILLAGGLWAWTLIAPKSNSNSSAQGNSSAPAETYQKYTNDQFHFSFMYPASWGAVTISQTQGPQNGATGVSSYDATFSNKSGGTDVLGKPNPYLFRVNSFKWAYTGDSFQPSQAYRVVASDGSNNEVSAGLSVCGRQDSDGEQCDLFSSLGDWQTINHIIVAKQIQGGVGLFASLAANTGENYTMASFYSSSGSDYDAFQKVAQS